MLIGIVGETLGIGKTTLLCFIGYCKQLEGYDIYTNFGVKYPHKYINDVSQIDSIQFGVLLGDDFWSWLNARSSMTTKSKNIAKVMLKSRKRGFDCYYSTQHEMLIDWQVQAITDIYMIPLFMNPDYELVQTFTRHGKLISRFVFKPKEIWDLFDTREEVDDIKDSVINLEPIVKSILKKDQFLGLTTKSSKVAFIKREYQLGREDCYLVIDMVIARLKKHYLNSSGKAQVKPKNEKTKVWKSNRNGLGLSLKRDRVLSRTPLTLRKRT